MTTLAFRFTAGGGTGAKYIIINGPVALQMGESTGPHRMVWVAKGEPFEGWTQGGWKYTTDQAMFVQWQVEDLSQGRYGLICGYERNTKLKAPAFRFVKGEEVRAEDLDCTIAFDQLMSGNAAPAAADTTDAVTTGAETYTEIFKYEDNGKFMCGAKSSDASYPTGWRHIEDYPTNNDFVYGSGTDSLEGYCTGNASDEAKGDWTTVLLNAAGVQEVTLPLK